MPRLDLLTQFPPAPFVVRNYKELCGLLNETPARGQSGRVAHFNYWRRFFTHESVIEGGVKRHAIRITSILNPQYVAWIPHANRWAHDSSLLLGHFLWTANQGAGPTVLTHQTREFVATTSDLMQLLGFGNRRLSRWRRGELPEGFGSEEESPVSQYRHFAKYVRDIIYDVLNSQLFLTQFQIAKTWVIQSPSTISDEGWRLASAKERAELDQLLHSLLSELGYKSVQDLFLKRKEQAFYDELALRIPLRFEGICRALQVWHIFAGSGEELSHTDKEELTTRQNARILEWARNRGFEEFIINWAIARRDEG